jgi:hypothetical protein
MKDPYPQISLKRDPAGQEENKYFFDPEDQRRKRLTNDNFEAELKLRKKYAKKSFWFAIGWLLFLVSLTVLQVFYRDATRGLKESEFIAVSTTTTAAVFGFWAIVLRSLFPSKSQETKKH